MLSKVAKDTLISGFGEFIYVGALYVITLLISRALGAEGIGIYAQAMTVIFLVSLLAQVGFDVGILRFLSLYLAKRDWTHVRGMMYFISWFILITSVVLGIGVFVAADFISDSFFDEPRLAAVLRVFAVTIPFLALRTVWLNGIQAFQRTDYRIYIGKIFVPLIGLGSIAVFLKLGWHWKGVLASTVLAAFVGGFLAYYVYLRLLKSIPGIEKENPQLAVKEWFLFCYPLLFSQLLALALPRLMILMLGFFRNSAEVGIYEIASKVVLLILMPLDLSSLIIAPIIGQLYAQGDSAGLQRLFKIVTKWILAISILIFVTIILLARPILAIFGPEFVTGIPVLYILAVGHLLNVSTGAVGWMLIMSGHPKTHMLISATSILFAAVLSLFLIPAYGVVGAAVVVSLIEIVINVVRLAAVIRLIGVHPYSWDFVKPVGAGLVTLVAAYLMRGEVTDRFASAFWIMMIVAGFVFFVYATLIFLAHWSQIKTLYPGLRENLRRMQYSA
jgi:O-antigen/teichoic acid export membrane protein